MAINKKSNPIKIDIDSHGLLARFAEIRHIYDSNAVVPADPTTKTADNNAYTALNNADDSIFANLSPSSVQLGKTNDNQSSPYVLTTDSDGLTKYSSIQLLFKRHLNDFIEKDIFVRRRILDSIVDSMTEDSDVNHRIQNKLTDALHNNDGVWDNFADQFGPRFDADSDLQTYIFKGVTDSFSAGTDSDADRFISHIFTRIEDSESAEFRRRFLEIFYQRLDSDSRHWASFWNNIERGYFDVADSEVNYSRRTRFLNNLIISTFDSEGTSQVQRNETAVNLATLLIDSDLPEQTSPLRIITNQLRNKTNETDYRYDAQIDEDVRLIIDQVVDSDYAPDLLVRGFENLSDAQKSAGMPLGRILSDVAAASLETVTIHRPVFYTGGRNITINDNNDIDDSDKLPSQLKFNRDSEFMDFAFPNPENLVEPTNLNNIKLYINGVRQIVVNEYTQITIPTAASGGNTLEDGTDVLTNIAFNDSDIDGVTFSPRVRPTATFKFIDKRYEVIGNDSDSRYQQDNYNLDSDGFFPYKVLRVYFAAINDADLDDDLYMWDSDTNTPTITEDDPRAYFLDNGDIVTIEYTTSIIEPSV